MFSIDEKKVVKARLEGLILKKLSSSGLHAVKTIFSHLPLRKLSLGLPEKIHDIVGPEDTKVMEYMSTSPRRLSKRPFHHWLPR